MYNEMHGGWCGFHGGPFTVLLWVVVIVAAVFFIRRYAPRRQGGGGSGAAPLEILKMRLARGEITAEEYENLKNKLKD